MPWTETFTRAQHVSSYHQIQTLHAVDWTLHATATCSSYHLIPVLHAVDWNLHTHATCSKLPSNGSTAYLGLKAFTRAQRVPSYHLIQALHAVDWNRFCMTRPRKSQNYNFGSKQKTAIVTQGNHAKTAAASLRLDPVLTIEKGPNYFFYFLSINTEKLSKQNIWFYKSCQK